MAYGADILQHITFSPRLLVGSVVDYAHYMYNTDYRLAHTPYHSLTINERSTLNARKSLLNFIGSRFRDKSLENAHLLATGQEVNGINRMAYIVPIDDMISFQTTITILCLFSQKEASLGSRCASRQIGRSSHAIVLLLVRPTSGHKVGAMFKMQKSLLLQQWLQAKRMGRLAQK